MEHNIARLRLLRISKAVPVADTVDLSNDALWQIPSSPPPLLTCAAQDELLRQQAETRRKLLFLSQTVSSADIENKEGSRKDTLWQIPSSPPPLLTCAAQDEILRQQAETRRKLVSLSQTVPSADIEKNEGSRVIVSLIGRDYISFPNISNSSPR
ncbi:unnamed protein product [Calypogeia fissa]